LSRSTRELTTTSYAILGLLAVRPWSTYELAKQMRRNLHYFWSRAESNLYAEPKRLVAEGLVEARSQPHGKRRRTVYMITRRGRKALAGWLREPADASRLESEPLVKVLFAPYGSKEDLLTTLRRFRDDAGAKTSVLGAIFQEYLRGEDPFPQRVHVNVVAYRLLWAYAQTEVMWAAWALDQVQRWRDTSTPTGRPKLMDVLRDALGEAAVQRGAAPSRPRRGLPGASRRLSPTRQRTL
jgi:PadR family transcriptional regulator AphA